MYFTEYLNIQCFKGIGHKTIRIFSAPDMTAGVSFYWMLQYEAQSDDFGEGKGKLP